MKVMIVGGSIAGLMNGVMLKHNGYDVHIIEQTPRVLKAQGAGIATSPYVKRFLERHDRLTSAFSFPCKGIRTINTEDRVINEFLLPMAMNSWDNFYLRLRANFDGLSSHVYPDPPLREPNDGDAVYDTGKRLKSINYSKVNELLVVQYEDVRDGVTQTMSVDLVIGADGANSTVRSLVDPSAPKRQYAGYVLWRGIVPEQELSIQVSERFGDWMSFCPVPRLTDLIVTYSIPGQDGSLGVGERGMNFAWYSHASLEDLSEILTDVDGHKHRWSVPMGKLSPTIWQKQLLRAETSIGNSCNEIASKITEPFVQVIGDYPPSKAAFYGGKILLVGDACCTLRPHSGSGVGQVALHSLLLEKALFDEKRKDYTIEIDEWERQVMDFAHVERLKSISWGEYYLGGWLGWLPAALRYHGIVQWKKWQVTVLGLLGW